MVFDPLSLQLLIEQRRADLAREAQAERLAAQLECGSTPPTAWPRRCVGALRRLVLAAHTATRSSAGRMARPLA
jgi:hypothetical protein